ncbi:MAG: hypothetical protein IJ725_00320 [Ruminococcus sp.]|nr:hypothetical protein [Ruminococcus sp.]
MKKFRFKGAVAASLAVIVAIGGAIGIGSLTSKLSNSFILSVNAAEITDDNSATISASGDHGFSYGEGDDDEVSYCLGLPVTCKGKNIDTVTYSVDRGALSVSWYKNNNPVIEGIEDNKNSNTPETVNYTEKDREYLNKQSEKTEQEHKGENPVVIDDDQYDPSVNYNFKHYSSVTLKYDNQHPEGSDISLVGSSTSLSKDIQSYLKAHRDELFNLYGKESMLEAQRVCIDKLLSGEVIHCKVTFKDGSTETEDIKLSTKIGKFSKINSGEYNTMPEEIRDDKDYKDVFVVYTKA